MADTSAWTLQDFANAAGKRTEPYPTGAEAAPAHEHQCCPGCGAALAGLTVKGSGLPRVYCSDSCRIKAQRRWRSHPDDTATLRLTQYLWCEF